MCGIVALISPGVPIREDLLVAMRDRLVHRGPDNGSHWFREGARIGLAHRRLSIIDLSHAADQPMVSDDGVLCLVFNGEIYNYIELRAELQAQGRHFRTKSDTEVLLVALQHWGDAALPKLNGMFAFALWDERSRRMLVARDRFGEKPLFIGRGKFGTTVFASEMKAILAHPQIDPSANEPVVARYARGDYFEEGEETFFAGIQRLPAAHAAWFRDDGVEEKRWRYWMPDYTAVDDSLSPREAVGRFAELVQKSVRLRLRSDVAVGSSLSGGLDSSVIVGLLAQERDSRTFTQNTFSAVFPEDPTMSEHDEIKAVVDHTGVTSYTVTPTAERLMQESRLLHWHQEEPFLSASIYLQWCVARLARSNGTIVLMDGQGADEVLAGYSFYFRQYQLDLIDRRQRSLARRESDKFNRRLNFASQRYEGASRRFDAKVAYAAADLDAMRPGSFLSAASSHPHTAPARPGLRLRRTLSEALLYNSLPMLLRYADRNSMAFGRETRLPYLDHDLVDFCIGLPDHYMIRNGWQKWILRQSAGQSIPAAIRWRAEKVGYAAPLDLWLRGVLKEWARDRLFDARLYSVPGYDSCHLRALWNEHQQGEGNHSWALWRWISLAEWLDILHSGWWRAGTYVKPLAA